MLKKVFGGILNNAEKKMFALFRTNRVDFEQYLEYNKLLTERPSLHSVKQNTIHKYRKRYGFKELIETGTYLGDMVEAQREHFEKVYSIELSESLYKNAVTRFKDVTNVEIIFGDSGLVLNNLVAELRRPTLFWLDGHYSSGVTAKGTKNTPILAELEIIMDAPISHGILIDDARLFKSEDDYPSIDELSSFIASIGKNCILSVADDIIRIFPRNQESN